MTMAADANACSSLNDPVYILSIIRSCLFIISEILDWGPFKNSSISKYVVRDIGRVLISISGTPSQQAETLRQLDQDVNRREQTADRDVCN